MGKRVDGYYPTDPYATEALRQFLLVHRPSALREPGVDNCAGYGALLEGLLVDARHRWAVEKNLRLRTELVKRVPSSQVVIGDGITTPLRDRANVFNNPNFTHEVMVAFVRRALEHRRHFGSRPLVAVFGLATYWQSEGHLALTRLFGRQDWTLGLGFRATCDGSGVGDMRAQGWLVWDGSHREPWSRHLVLPKPVVAQTVIREHARLASLGAHHG